MEHVQISIEEYNKLRDFYLQAQDDEFVPVLSFLVNGDDVVKGVRRSDLEESIIDRCEKALKDNEDLFKDMGILNYKLWDARDDLNKIPKWIRRIFKAT